jgi:hypothetical protein
MARTDPGAISKLTCLTRTATADGSKRCGRAPEGYLDRRAAERAMDALIDETAQELAAAQPNHEATCADAVASARSL